MMLQLAATFTIYNVLEKNLVKILLMEKALFVPFIHAASVRKEKINSKLNYTLLFVGVVLQHIIANVCQGYFSF